MAWRQIGAKAKGQAIIWTNADLSDWLAYICSIRGGGGGGGGGNNDGIVDHCSIFKS